MCRLLGYVSEGPQSAVEGLGATEFQTFTLCRSCARQRGYLLWWMVATLLAVFTAIALVGLLLL